MTIPTRFDPMIQAVARKAENIYSKMAIRRDESQDSGRRKKNGNEAELSSIPWEDTTEVSVLALIGFLEDLLGVKHTSAVLAPHDADLPLSTPEQPHAEAPPTPVSQAAKAYRATGRVVHDENVVFDSPAPNIPQTPTATEVQLGNTFGEAEREQMRGYIQDLQDLEGRGVTHLTLRRSLTFLESIHQAIESVK